MTANISFMVLRSDELEAMKAEAAKHALNDAYHNLVIRAHELENVLLRKESGHYDDLKFCSDCEMSAFFDLVKAIEELNPKEAKPHV
jgi:hypothetical protein